MPPQQVLQARKNHPQRFPQLHAGNPRQPLRTDRAGHRQGGWGKMAAYVGPGKTALYDNGEKSAEKPAEETGAVQ